MSLGGYLAVAAALFTLGIVMYISRKNSIAILMGVELILNGAALNFVAFAKFTPSQASQLDGQIFAIFIILLAAAEAVVALAIVLSVYRELKQIMADKLVSLKG
ncbi:MAG: NADH-quinone oxidoreductase subunit NuoK [Proteobacteria bacterium]|nr:NADH-quinone oxidoreductase subunit NuoK [Pseudomonadota bacterium]